MNGTNDSEQGVTSRVIEHFIPPVCPHCGQLDQVQKVSAIVAAGTTLSTSIGAMPVFEPGINRTGLDGQPFTPPGHVIYRPTVGVTNSTTLLARRLTLPVRFAPAPSRPWAYNLLFVALLGAVWLLPISWIINAPFAGIVASLVAVLITGKVLRMYRRERKRVLGLHRERMAVWKAARDVYEQAKRDWYRSYYCHRCDMVFVQE